MWVNFWRLISDPCSDILNDGDAIFINVIYYHLSDVWLVNDLSGHNGLRSNHSLIDIWGCGFINRGPIISSFTNEFSSIRRLFHTYNVQSRRLFSVSCRNDQDSDPRPDRLSLLHSPSYHNPHEQCSVILVYYWLFFFYFEHFPKGFALYSVDKNRLIFLSFKIMED